MVASQGIILPGKSGKNKYLNIEDTAKSPIAKKYDLEGDVGAAEGGSGKQIDIHGQLVDMGHVIAGLDASLSGAPKSLPDTFLKETGYKTWKSSIKYTVLKSASGGNIRDFATFAGDIGQAYAEFLVQKYLNDSTTTFKEYFAAKAGDDELRGDIHGYILSQVVGEVKPEQKPSGTSTKISDMLKVFYLGSTAKEKTPRQSVPESDKGSSYKDEFLKSTGKTEEELRAFISSRALRFANTWYLMKAFEARKWYTVPGKYLNPNDFFIAEFSQKHAKNKASGRADDQIDVLIDHFMKLLDEKYKQAPSQKPVAKGRSLRLKD